MISMENKNRRDEIQGSLLQLVDLTLADKNTGPNFRSLLNMFKVSVTDFKTEFLLYNLGNEIGGYENANYQKITSRLVLHFHNLIKGSYHIKRQEIITSFLKKARPNIFCDVGFGVPAPYLLSYMSENPNTQAILVDEYASAKEFSVSLVSSLDPKLLERMTFISKGMNSGEFAGEIDTYLHLDSIEHTKDPTEYLKRIVSSAKPGSNFIFSLPICSMKGMENFHFIEWLTEIDARIWLESAGLKIVIEDQVFPNPKVDYFAELIEGRYHNYLVLAQK